MKEKILVSACLLGEACRYDGRSKMNPAVAALAERYEMIPVCPEVMGGLSCPRYPSEQQDGRVCNAQGQDVTENFARGAAETVAIAEAEHPVFALFKARSPSCGHGEVYDGTFTGTLVPGDGVTTSALLAIGIPVYTEEDINHLPHAE